MLTTLSPRKRTRTRHDNRRALRHLETLEPRMLLSISVSSYAIPDFAPYLGVYAAEDLWLVGNQSGDNGISDNVIQRVHDAVAVGDPISLEGFSPSSIAADDTFLYLADTNSIVRIALDSMGVGEDPFVPETIVDGLGANSLALTVTADGSLWFTTFVGTSDSYVSRWQDGDEPTLLSAQIDAPGGLAAFIVADDSDAVWVGLTSETGFGGTSYIAYASFDDVTGEFQVKSDADSLGNANNTLTGVAPDGNGGVWYSLAAAAIDLESPVVDLMVRAEFIGTDLNTITTLAPSEGLFISGLALDDAGRLWFNELSGTMIHYYDTVNELFESVADPDGTQSPSAFIASPNLGEVCVLDSRYDEEFNPLGTYIIRAVAAEQPPVEFVGETHDLNGLEDSDFALTALAEFTAPPLASGDYTATINWGDGTTSVVTANFLGANAYAVVIHSKSYATQGTYYGTVTITSPANEELGVLPFTATISDIPLQITSFNITPLFFRVAVATATFTDDSGLPISTFKATINWGDGTTSRGIIVRDPTQAGRYIVLAVHVYRRSGNYTTQLSISTTEQDAEILKSTASTSIRV